MNADCKPFVFTHAGNLKTGIPIYRKHCIKLIIMVINLINLLKHIKLQNPCIQ